MPHPLTFLHAAQEVPVPPELPEAPSPGPSELPDGPSGPEPQPEIQPPMETPYTPATY